MRVEGINSTAAGKDQPGVRQAVREVTAKNAQSVALRQVRQEFPKKEDASSEPDIARTSLADLLKESEYELNFQLSFSVHKETQRLVVKVIDPDNNKVIREIPPEELLDLAVKLQEMIGLLIDKRI